MGKIQKILLLVGLLLLSGPAVGPNLTAERACEAQQKPTRVTTAGSKCWDSGDGSCVDGSCPTCSGGGGGGPRPL